MSTTSFSRTSEFYDQCLDGETNFTNIDLSETTLDRLLLTQSCNFQGASFLRASLVKASMPKCAMTSATFDHANLTDANLAGAILDGASLSNTILTGSNLENADLRGANFQGAELTNANFTNAIYDINTVFDQGVNPASLGMKTVANNGQSSSSERQSKRTHDSVLMAEVHEEKPKAKKTKEIWYRGSRTIVEIEDSTHAQDDSTVKEIWYRGSRTIVETKAAKPSHRDMNYRGVKNS